MLSSGCNFLKKSFFDQSLEDFYKEARDKFELRFGLKAAVGEPVLCEDLNILRSRHMGAFGQALIVQHKKNKIHFVMKLTNKKEVLFTALNGSGNEFNKLLLLVFLKVTGC